MRLADIFYCWSFSRFIFLFWIKSSHVRVLLGGGEGGLSYCCWCCCCCCCWCCFERLQSERSRVWGFANDRHIVSFYHCEIVYKTITNGISLSTCVKHIFWRLSFFSLLRLLLCVGVVIIRNSRNVRCSWRKTQRRGKDRHLIFIDKPYHCISHARTASHEPFKMRMWKTTPANRENQQYYQRVSRNKTIYHLSCVAHCRSNASAFYLLLCNMALLPVLLLLALRIYFLLLLTPHFHYFIQIFRLLLRFGWRHTHTFRSCCCSTHSHWHHSKRSLFPCGHSTR